MKKNILFLVSNVEKTDNIHKTGVWLSEFAVPYKKFLEEGFDITVASPEGHVAPIDEKSIPKEKCEYFDEVKKQLDNTSKLSDLDYDEFDAVVVAGGHSAMIDLVGNIDVGKLIGLFFYNKKLIATICHGASALISARTKENRPIVEGKDVTGFSDAEEKESNQDLKLPFSLEAKLKELGANYSCGKPFTSYVIDDEQLITAQNPQSVEQFADAVINNLIGAND